MGVANRSAVAAAADDRYYRLSHTEKMPSYKLIYFNGRGRAEVIRYIFAQAGVEYTDERLTGEEYAERKGKGCFPANSVPVLEVDGKALAGSEVIGRYLGEKFGLAGENDWDNAQLASLVDLMVDLFNCLLPVHFGKDDDAKAEAKKKLLEESIPNLFGCLEKRIVANDSPDGWAYGKKMTYVDMRIAVGVEQLFGIDANVLDPYPAIKKLHNAVNSQPKIAEWIKKRPDTPF